MKESINIETKLFKRAGTHDGKFHADEVMATAILHLLFDIEVVRTRDPKTLGELEIVYDVGGGKFDHHGIEKRYRESGTPFAACGLIWYEYGREAIHFLEPSLAKEEIESVFQYVDRALIEGIDAQDNGIRFEETSIPLMNISIIISGYNPPWYSDDDEHNAFNKAIPLCIDVLKSTINRRVAVFKSKNIVIQAYKKRDIREILVLDRYCLWEEALLKIDEHDEVLFVVFPEKDQYVIQTVKERDGNIRKNLPEAWAGRENKELAAITGIDGAVFCHSGRFLAIARTFGAVMQMAEQAIQS